MPRPIAIDKEQVRMLVMELGAEEAARRVGIKSCTVRQWAKRGGWSEGNREKVSLASGSPTPAKIALAATLPETLRPVVVTGVTKPADALRDVLADGVRKTKIGLTRYVARMAEEAADGGTLEQAPLLKAVADIHGKMHPEQQDGDRVSLSFFSISVGASEGPVVDV